MLINLIFNIFYYLGIFILEHPVISIIVFFIFVFLVSKKFGNNIWRKTGRNIENSIYGVGSFDYEKEKLLVEYEKQKMLSGERYEPKKKEPKKVELECPNCGATLKAKYAICEYCGTRCNSVGDDN